MNPIERHRLINEIALALASSSSSSEDRASILRDYEIKIYNAKLENRESIKKALNPATDESLTNLARHLKLSLDHYAGKEKQKVTPTLRKIFISHSNEDNEIVKDFIEILEKIGVPDNIIFCSSIKEYGTPLGQDTLKAIKERLNDDVFVFFMISENFYKSPMSLCEMGAAWIMTKDHIPVVIPPFSLKNTEGVFRDSQVINVNNHYDMNLLKETLEHKFKLTPKKNSKWERPRGIIIERINKRLERKYNG